MCLRPRRPIRTSPARPAADSRLVKEITATVIANTRSDHFGALPRWIGVEQLVRVEEQHQPDHHDEGNCSTRSPATSRPTRRSGGLPKPRMLPSTTNAMNASASSSASRVMPQRMPEHAQVLGRREGGDGDQDDVVEQDRPAGDEADELVERVASEHRRAAPILMQRGALRRRSSPSARTAAPRAGTRAQVISGMIRIATMLATLIIGLIAGPAVSLNGSPTVSPVTDGGVSLGALAAVGAVLDQLLRVVPGAAAGGHQHAKKKPTTITPISRPPSAWTVDQPDDQRQHDRQQRRQDHLALGGLRDDVHAGRVVGLFGVVHDPRVLAELAAHLLDDRAAGATDGLDRQRGEQAHHQPAEQQADQHGRFVDAEGDRVPELGPSSSF
jgi:hypothetical protein